MLSPSYNPNPIKSTEVLTHSSRPVPRSTCTHTCIANNWPEETGQLHDLHKAKAKAILTSGQLHKSALTSIQGRRRISCLHQQSHKLCLPFWPDLYDQLIASPNLPPISSISPVAAPPGTPGGVKELITVEQSTSIYTFTCYHSIGGDHCFTTNSPRTTKAEAEIELSARQNTQPDFRKLAPPLICTGSPSQRETGSSNSSTSI